TTVKRQSVSTLVLLLGCMVALPRQGAALRPLPGSAPPPAADAEAKAASATAAAPTFTPAPGSFSGSVSVTMKSATAGAAIYYTLDGTAPSRKTSPVYSSPVALSHTTTVKAFAYKKGLKASATTVGVYTVTAPPPPPPPPNETGGSLLLATLTPQTNATSNG